MPIRNLVRSSTHSCRQKNLANRVERALSYEQDLAKTIRECVFLSLRAIDQAWILTNLQQSRTNTGDKSKAYKHADVLTCCHEDHSYQTYRCGVKDGHLAPVSGKHHSSCKDPENWTGLVQITKLSKKTTIFERSFVGLTWKTPLMAPIKAAELAVDTPCASLRPKYFRKVGWDNVVPRIAFQGIFCQSDAYLLILFGDERPYRPGNRMSHSRTQLRGISGSS